MVNRNLSPRLFDNTKPLVARVGGMVLEGVPTPPGTLIPADMDHGIRLRLWMSERAMYQEDHKPTPVATELGADDTKDGEDPWAAWINHTGGGWYDIKAPWMEQPERLRGEDKALARAKELYEAGDPSKKPEPNPDVPPAQPDWEGYATDPADWDDAQRETFTTWFTATKEWLDGQPEDTTISFAHDGAAAGFKALRDEGELPTKE